MAGCGDIIAENFPTLDSDLKEYINGVLDEEAEDFESASDVYDAVGDMLLQGSDCYEQDEIEVICHKLYNTLRHTTQKKTTHGLIRILSAPINLGEMAGRFQEDEEEQQTVWMVKKDLSNVAVDQKKLEKAEAKIKQKQEKRSMTDNGKTTDYQEQTATVSQQTNRREAKMESSGQNKSYDVRIENFDISFGERCLVQCGELNMAFGRRYGLVGRNGIGKTTLLRMLSLRQLKIPSHISLLHVEQEVVGDDTPAVQSVLECDLRREGLLKEEREISAKLASTSPSSDGSLSTRLTQVYAELESIESDKAPAKAAVILCGLGFTPQMQKMTTRVYCLGTLGDVSMCRCDQAIRKDVGVYKEGTKEGRQFSGGWRMRLALARALFTRPDLLLLDEPTNMLDMKAILWLENYLQTWPTTLLVVSHDREFLNAVSTDIIYLHARKLESYKGNYENFVKAREEKLKNQQREYEAQLQYRQHAQEFIDKFRYNAKRASLVQSKLKVLEKLPPLIPVEKESEVQLRLTECEHLSSTVIQLDEVSFGYTKDKVLFKNVNLSASSSSRICIVGDNGTGKTTLLKILTEEIQPLSGLRHTHRALRLGYFSQHHVDQLDMNMTSVEVLHAKFPGRTAEEYRNKLGCFGVSGELGVRPVCSLSGGQKSRVAFAQMAMSNPNFFILDEPTNHLDMETIEALGKALEKFKGGVILVSHDERLVRLICTELWLCANQSVKTLEGGIDEYKKLVEQELASQS